jgi:hypothetical protein
MGWPIDFYKYLDVIGKGNYGNVISNYKFYAKKMIDLKHDKRTFNITTHLEGMNDDFLPSSPSIIPHKDGYLVNQRYVNYFIESNGSYTIRDNHPITTYNRRLILDRDLNLVSQWDFDKFAKPADKYLGIEDVKIVPFKGKVYFFGTEQDIEISKICPPGLCVAQGEYPTDDSTHALNSVSCPSPYGQGVEKNWCYFEDVSREGKPSSLKVMYKWRPMTIGHLEGKFYKEDSSDNSVPEFFQHLRGSSHGVVVGDELWFLCHMVEYSSPRNYYHIIIILDRETLKHKRHSMLFKFEDSQIEYSLGFVVEKKRMIFGYSRMDRETILTAYERPMIDEFLFPQRPVYK